MAEHGVFFSKTTSSELPRPQGGVSNLKQSPPPPLHPLPPEADKPARGGGINKDAIHPRAQHGVFWHNCIKNYPRIR